MSQPPVTNIELDGIGPSRTICLSSRRTFLKHTGLCLGGAAFFGSSVFASFAQRGVSRHILLRSGWQVENIGDVAHTPSMLALIEKYIPDTKVTFWPWYDYLPDNEVAMLKKRFPKLEIVRGTLDADGQASTPELQTAIASAGSLRLISN